MEENTPSKCICTIAAMYGCKLLQLCEHEANCELHPENISSCSMEDKDLTG